MNASVIDTPTQASGTAEGLEERTDRILGQAQRDTSELRRNHQYKAALSRTDEAVKEVWYAYEDHAKKVSNAYAHLFRMRRTNIAAQRMMLEAFPDADSLPEAVVSRLGESVQPEEVLQAIKTVHSNKARGKCTPRSRWIDQQGPALTLDVGD